MSSETVTQYSRKKNYTWLFILVPILIIATCNFIVNTQNENNIIENPKPGNYFVFRGLVSERDQAFKVKIVEKDSIEFYIPKYEMWEFKINSSESKIRDLDKSNKLYDSAICIKLAKSTIDSLVKNSEFGSRISKNPKTYYITAFN